ncbi:hypothetical protein AAF712_009152 [Marasmius tenuissimus]|uniref:Alpha/beta hydrolase fold-3 domain-containing protein n=1 Tax=Marasmius tenuissimus TaxID=585030 RepID=A0ABR2ZJ91_9AGAR|nr:hypothetical protein PM082_015362 [Marasmius tenuissimus]
MAEWSDYSQIDPEFAPLVDTLPSLPTDLPIEQVRGFLDAAVEQRKAKLESSLPPSSEYTVAEHEIPVGGGVTAFARSVVPKPRDGEDGIFPVLFWLHGGGFVVGDRNVDDYWLRIASVEVRITVVNFEYRLAPEHVFPTAVDDSFAALKFVASNPDKFSAALKKGFLVGGTSAGANVAASLSHLARDDSFFNDKPVTGQLLHIPPVVHYEAVPPRWKSSYLSFEQNKDAPILNKSKIEHFYSLYKPDPKDTKFSPLLLDTHKGLPPAYFQICGLDPLRDEGLIYERVLREANVPTKYEVYPGVPHAFENAAPHLKQAVKLREDRHTGLKWLLEQGEA